MGILSHFRSFLGIFGHFRDFQGYFGHFRGFGYFWSFGMYFSNIGGFKGHLVFLIVLGYFRVK